ncbi:hypothetical protein ACM8AQ_23015 [Pseudomonas aeruginosa]
MQRKAESEIRLYRNRLRTKALMLELGRRTASPTPQKFACWFDKTIKERRPHLHVDTAESNRWRPSFNGKSALQSSQLELLQELFSDAIEFYHNGPSGMWIALWGDIEALKPLCKTHLEDDAHYIQDEKIDWSDHPNQTMSLKESIKNFIEIANYEIYLNDEIALGFLSEAIALHRLQTHAATNNFSTTNNTELYKVIFRLINCTTISDSLVGLGILSETKEETEQLETMHLTQIETYWEKVGFLRRPSAEQAKVYSLNPIEWWFNEGV